MKIEEESNKLVDLEEKYVMIRDKEAELRKRKELEQQKLKIEQILNEKTDLVADSIDIKDQSTLTTLFPI
nr:hypothetical protein [Tanacetum cinerariifolium]